MSDRMLIIRGGELVDPASGFHGVGDLSVQAGSIVELPVEPPADAEIFDARGLVVAPGFWDLHVHLREPGNEAAETIASGTRAAAHGGFTTVIAMPNTRPPLDDPQRVTWVRARAAEAGWAHVLPAACLTRERAGREAADLDALAAAGAVAFTDDGTTVPETGLMREVMQAASRLRLPVLDHAQDPAAEVAGVMHAGEYAVRWQLPGIPAEAESRMVERDIALAAETGCRVHIQHVTAAQSIARIRDARAAGLPISGEVTPHHLAFTDADVRGGDPHFKMNPPLRSAADREALLEALLDGTLTVLATDHAPHTAQAKAAGFHAAPFGVVGLETAVGATYSGLVRRGLLDVVTWVRRWTSGPAEILGLPTPTLRPGAPADLVVLDLHSEWTVHAHRFISLGRNTPFEGCSLVGRAVMTVLGGKMLAEAV